jgi:hypothetical protein
METFTEPKELTENPRYKEQRQKSLLALADVTIDAPIIDIIKDFNKQPYCFTMQSCYGHFVYDGQKDPNNLEPLPDTNSIAKVEYRIAYIAFCIDNSDSGRGFFESLKRIEAIDPDNVQFCSAEWFWKRQVNSYALQVEPERFKHQDTAILDYREALNIEKIRNEFFAGLDELLRSLLNASGGKYGKDRI